MSVPTFVVGTGRCGSTMLSNMLREHPKVLSLSEFYAMITDAARVDAPFAREPMDGRQFWAIIAAITPFHRFQFQHQLAPAEMLYPYDDPGARFSAQTGVPVTLLTTIPHLTDDFDHLFERLETEVSDWPEAGIGEHYRHLFGWLSNHFGKRLWIERSGGSLGFAGRMLEIFPDARFVHIVRDGRDAALSMRAHLGFQFGVALFWIQQRLGVDPLTSPDRSNIARVPPELRPFLPENVDLAAARSHGLSLPACGEFWSQTIVDGMKVLAALSGDRLLTLRYEDFFENPKQQLDAFAGFLGGDYVDEDWSTRCAATVRKPRSTWRELPEADACGLTEACQPGFELLRQAGVHYEI